MDSSDPMYWLIMGLAVLIAVLALRDPLHKDPRDDTRHRRPQQPGDERRDPPR